MGWEDHEPLEPVSPQRFEVRVEQRHQHLGTDGEGARKCHVMIGRSRPEHGRDQGITELPCHPRSQRLSQPRVRPLRQVRPVLLDRARADDRTSLSRDQCRFDLRPRHSLDEQLLSRFHG